MNCQDVLDEGSRRRKTQGDVKPDHEICTETRRSKGMMRYNQKELTNLSLSRLWNALAACNHITGAKRLLG